MGARRRLGVFGGTFDPIHVGHLACASEVASRLGLDEVVFVPAGQPWQKQGRAVSPAEDRYAMVVLATAADPRFGASRVDVDRPGPTYTEDTLRDLRAERGDAELHLLAGADVLATLPTWHDPAAVLAQARLVAFRRPGHEVDASSLPETDVTVVDVPALAVSSSDCRSRVRSGVPIDYLVPGAVVSYIAKRGLYRDGGAGS